MGTKTKVSAGILGGIATGAFLSKKENRDSLDEFLGLDKFKEIIQLIGIALIFIVVLFLISKI